jgi:hypothetical protein
MTHTGLHKLLIEMLNQSTSEEKAEIREALNIWAERIETKEAK